MGCSHKLVYIHRFLLLFISFPFILMSSFHQLRFLAEGRPIVKSVGFPQATVREDKTILSAQIGSRPPRCERRCSTCGHCEAIQVPTNPQVKPGGSKSSWTFYASAYARRDDSSNYKPMSWKCKCGNLIFNP